MTDNQRHSIAETARLIDDPVTAAERESENAIRQFDRVLDLIDDVARGGRPFRLRPSIILDLHRIALDGLDAYAGNYRPGGVEIGLSTHVPPAAHLVSGCVEEMCDHINDQFSQQTALYLCAYTMWRLNWIHPFTDGNGRTSRSLAYYVLCAKLGYRLPGHITIPEQIASGKDPYYNALEAADRQCAKGDSELAELIGLLKDCLANQLLSAFADADRSDNVSPTARRFH